MEVTSSARMGSGEAGPKMIMSEGRDASPTRTKFARVRNFTLCTEKWRPSRVKNSVIPPSVESASATPGLSLKIEEYLTKGIMTT